MSEPIVPRVRIVTIYRYQYTEKCTIGKMFIDNEFFGFTLEDVVRPNGIKVPKFTAIPEGTYEVRQTHSRRYDRLLPEVMFVPNFTGIRIHGGNNAEDSEGCILVGSEKVGDTIRNSLMELFINKVKEYSHVYLTIHNLRNV